MKLSQAIAGGRPTNLGNALAQSHACCFRKIFHEDYDFSTEVRAEQDDACHGAATVLTLLPVQQRLVDCILSLRGPCADSLPKACVTAA